MKITYKMVNEFNEQLKFSGCVFRLNFGNTATSGNTLCEVVLANKIFVDSFIINPNREFYTLLECFFNKEGIELSYNNTKTTFWSKNGWED